MQNYRAVLFGQCNISRATHKQLQRQHPTAMKCRTTTCNIPDRDEAVLFETPDVGDLFRILAEINFPANEISKILIVVPQMPDPYTSELANLPHSAKQHYHSATITGILPMSYKEQIYNALGLEGTLQEEQEPPAATYRPDDASLHRPKYANMTNEPNRSRTDCRLYRNYVMNGMQPADYAWALAVAPANNPDRPQSPPH